MSAKTARQKIRDAAAAAGWQHSTQEAYVDEFRKGRRHVRIVTDTYGRLTLVTTETQHFGGSGKLQHALEALAS